MVPNQLYHPRSPIVHCAVDDLSPAKERTRYALCLHRGGEHHIWPQWSCQCRAYHVHPAKLAVVRPESGGRELSFALMPPGRSDCAGRP